MPPERQGTQKRRRLPFNPPRPRDSTRAAAGPSNTSSKTKPPAKAARSTANAAASSSKSTRKIPAASASASASSRSKAPARSRPAATDSDSESGSRSGSDSGSESDGGGRGSERSFSGEPDYILAEITNNDAADDVMSSEPVIPSKLLTRLLHHHFKSEKTKVAKDANAVVAKYVDVFVREALARAAYERAEGLGVGVGGSGGRMSIGDGFLEVEDLEKMAPQLALDF